MVAQQGAASLQRVYAPKVHGAQCLHAAHSATPLHACVLYSSVAALLGGAGQANYSAASAELDAIAAWRRAHGQAGISLQWGPWASAGMAAGSAVKARLRAVGITPLSLSQGLAALRVALLPQPVTVIAVLEVSWSCLLGTGETPPLLEQLKRRRRSHHHRGHHHLSLIHI